MKDLLFRKYGALCIPTQPGTVLPYCSYVHWRQAPPDIFDYSDIWAKYPGAEPTVLCGTGDLFAIDVDVKNGAEACAVFMGLINTTGLYVEKTKSGGFHIWFRHKEPIHSTALAYKKQDDGKYLPIVEIKGTTPCRISPANGIIKVSGDPENIPYLSSGELARLIDMADRVNEKVIEKNDVSYSKDKIVGIEAPGEDYSSNANIEDIIDLLCRHGWAVAKRSAGRILLRRPGARTKNHDADILVAKRVFKCYSPSVPDFNNDKAYSFFALRSILDFSGDYKATAKALHEEGYGKSIVVSGRKEVDDYYSTIEEQTEELNGMEKLAGRKVTLSNPPKKPKYTLTYTDFKSYVNRHAKDETVGIGVGGSFGYVSGHAKSRKSTILTAMVASAIDHKTHLGFRLHSEGDIVIIDTEQPEFWAYQTVRRICIQANIKDLPGNVHFYQLRGMGGAKELRELVEIIVINHPNMTALVIDGIKDLATDYVSDHKEASSLVSYLMWVASGRGKDCLVLTVIHLNPGSEKARGQLGTELQNKCDFSINVAKQDDDTSMMTFPNVRGAATPPAVNFEALQCNIPHLLGHPKPDYDFTIGAMDVQGADPVVANNNIPESVVRRMDEDLDNLPF